MGVFVSTWVKGVNRNSTVGSESSTQPPTQPRPLSGGDGCARGQHRGGPHDGWGQASDECPVIGMMGGAKPQPPQTLKQADFLA